MNVEHPIFKINFAENSLDEQEVSSGSSSINTPFDVSDSFIPDGALQSEILTESMIKQLTNVLPARTDGYPWVSIYSSFRDGFCLSTLYRWDFKNYSYILIHVFRKMEPWLEFYSPVLLIVRDDRGRVFGALISDALRQCEHYYGTPDACFLFKFVEPNDSQDNDSYGSTTSSNLWVSGILYYLYCLSL